MRFCAGASSNELKHLGHHVLFAYINVADPASVNAAISSTFQSLGRIDIFINNAGILGPTTAVIETQNKDWPTSWA